MKRHKKYIKVAELLSKKSKYTINEAVVLLPQVSTSKFEGSVELHINLKLNEKQKKEIIKGSTSLPFQVGTTAKKIAVITSPDNSPQAKEADVVGGEELIKKIEDGWTDFDVLIATPDMMPKIARLGKILGPKGKMPNPKNETVTTNLTRAIANYKKGKTDFKADKQGGIHIVVGKVKMKGEELKANIMTLLKAINQETIRLQGIPFKSIHLSPTMGPAIELDVNSALKDLTS